MRGRRDVHAPYQYHRHENGERRRASNGNPALRLCIQLLGLWGKRARGSRDRRPDPVSLYAQTKIDSERELLAGLRDNVFVTILRFATVFGDSRRARFDLVGNLFTAQAMTDGLITVIGPDQFRPFIHVRDLRAFDCHGSHG